MVVRGSLTAVAAFAVALAAAADPAPTPAPLTTCRAVREYLRREGLPPPRVELEAVVIDQDPARTTLFLRDDTGVALAVPAAEGRPFEPRSRGDRVRIVGRPYAGRVFGNVKATAVTLLGAGTAAPRPITGGELASGAAHHDLVALAGIGRAVVPGDEEIASLIVNPDGRLDVAPVSVVFDAPVEADALRRFVDADLRIVGRGSGDANDRRELISTFLRVRSPADVEVLRPAPADPFGQPATAFTDVSARQPVGEGPPAGGHRIKVVGVAVAADVDGGLFLSALEDAPERQDVGLFVRPAEAGASVTVTPGDLVEAVGFPAKGAFAAFLDAAEVRVVGRGVVPPPHRLEPSSVWQENWSALRCDSERIEVAVEVVSRVDRPDTTEIEADNELATFRIHAPPGLPADIRAGTRLRVVGLARATATRQHPQQAWLTLPSRFDLFVTSPADIAFTVPWWTRRGLVAALGWALAATAAAAAVATALAFALRRTVKRQVALLERKMQDEVVVEERRRIAREFHDSLEQDLAGLALRLDAAAGGVADDETRGVLERQRSLVARLQAETRQFVWDLRDPERAHWSFVDLLAAQIEDQQPVAGVPIRLHVQGEPARVPLASRHHLLRIVREAVANASRHAAPAAIDVLVTGGPGDRLRVEIRDDGIGFDLAACERKRGHFGIRGMRERARRIGATVAIDSRLRVGTSLVVTLGAAAPE